MSKRFVANSDEIKCNEEYIEVLGDTANHIKVLRHEVGDNVNINEYMLEITEIRKNSVYGKIVGKIQEYGVPIKNITLIQSYLKADKMEYVVQKATELGAKYIQPVISQNTVVKLDPLSASKKVDRLNKIAIEAIGQCGRTDEVQVLNVTDLNKLDLTQFDLVILCYEKAQDKFYAEDIKNRINEASTIAVIIGPEGGFAEDEVEYMSKFDNVISVIFGQRILRAETASIYSLSVLDYILSDNIK